MLPVSSIKNDFDPNIYEFYLQSYACEYRITVVCEIKHVYNITIFIASVLFLI